MTGSAVRRRGLVVAGTSSDAGKSLVVAGLCRVLARRGIAVAPFKSQNMSNNSMVCADGSEIGRAQYLQAQAAGVPAESAMNPVLLKPGSDRRSHVVLRGKPYGTLEAGQYATGRQQLATAAYQAFEDLSERYETIICEGAGSPAEINLRAGDYVNLGLARRFELPMVIVGDIDRGGVLASLYGTVMLLDADDRAVIKAYLINKFRGDQSVLDPGLQMITERTGVPCAGVLPWLPDLWLDSEDTLEVGSVRRSADPDTALRVAVVRLPRISNATDVDALAAEPGVDVTVTTDPGAIAGADLVVLPGSRSTVSDLRWLRERGIAATLADRARREAPVLGICGGFQMMARSIDDPIESGVGSVEGLGLLPVTVDFVADKTLGRPTGQWHGHPVRAYEIHHGVARIDGAEGFLDGCRSGQVWGTMWHGTLENDAFRRGWLAEVAAAAGSRWQPDPDAAGFADRRETMINSLAAALDDHADIDLILDLAGVA
ncbi:cobyric acid synthase [Microlunatus soli]|uniref:Cobyric acid synthase n=1 Tax=Microlunatus soli TaxID=630515 RepID=A0A1H1ZGF8_9ACTN|nr:cobyric acid synthase [Microlunatus soli]SDT32657.1 adenosylcobyric acid synthase (glutamine-hydrolysing) [Microlunatus soli]